MRTCAAGPGGPPHRAYLCDEDERVALQQALTAAGLWHGGPGSLVVRLNRLAHHRGAFHHPDRRLLDDLDGRLRLVGVSQLAWVSVITNEDLVERLAQAIHEHYLVGQVRNGVPMGANESMRPWTVAAPAPAAAGAQPLPEDRKAASRAQARHIGDKLARIGCAVAPWSSAGPPLRFRNDEVELLAELEHERWRGEREVAGWVYDPVRDDRARRHDRLVDWADLPEPERDKDRQAVRDLPEVLATAGLQIVRLDPGDPGGPGDPGDPGDPGG